MCLLAIAWQAHPEWPLVVSANRDEYYARPAAPMHWWADAPVLAGRDLEAGGTWLGITRSGRFAALTNVRGAAVPPGARSRGALVRDFLCAKETASGWADRLGDSTAEMAGFNLLLCDGRELLCLSNAPHARLVLAPGVHALGNAELGHDWPKIEHARRRLEQALGGATLDTGRLLELLESPRSRAAPEDSEAWLEEIQSTPFIVSGQYGTRASTALLIGRDGKLSIAERSFDRGQPVGEQAYSFVAG